MFVSPQKLKRWQNLTYYIVGIDQTSFKITYLKCKFLYMFFMRASISNTRIFTSPPTPKKKVYTFLLCTWQYLQRHCFHELHPRSGEMHLYEVCQFCFCGLHPSWLLSTSSLRSKNQYEKDNIFNKQWLLSVSECSFWDGKRTCLHQMTNDKTCLVFFWNQNNVFCSSVKMCACLDTARSFI